MNVLKLIVLTTATLASAASFGQDNKYGMGMKLDPDGWKKCKHMAAMTRGTYANIPPAASIQKWTPVPGSQGQTGTCTAWASTYCAATICWAQNNGVTDRQQITNNAMLPGYTYLHVKDNGDYGCNNGSDIGQAVRFITNTGALKYSSSSEKCCLRGEPNNASEARQNRFTSNTSLFFEYKPSGNASKVEATKKAIAEGRPVVFGMQLPNSFMNTSAFNSEGLYKPTENVKAYSNCGGHAMCIVAYDDNKFGGAFLVQNSWGTSWGKKGYFWLDYYTYANTTTDAYSVYVPIREAPGNTVDLNTNNLNFTTYKFADCQTGDRFSDFEVYDDNGGNNGGYDDYNGGYDYYNGGDDYYNGDYSYDDNNDYYYDDNDYYNNDDYNGGYSYDDDYNSYYNDYDNNDWNYNDDYNNYSQDDYDYYNNDYNDSYSDYAYDPNQDWNSNYDNYSDQYDGYDNYGDYDYGDDDYNDYGYNYGSCPNVSRGITPKGDSVDVYRFGGNIRLVTGDKVCMEGRLTENGVIEIPKPYKSGTRFRVIVGNSQPCYVYVFGTDLTNQVYNIFPQSKLISPFLPYKNSAVAFPDEKHWIEMDGNTGTDYLYVLYSLCEIDIDKLQKRMAEIPGDYESKIFKALGPKAFSIKDAKFTGKTCFRFSSTTPEKNTMVAIVKFSHVK